MSKHRFTDYTRPEDKPKPIPCKHHEFNLYLIKERRARDYIEAMGVVRTFMCGCKKCHPLKVYAGQVKYH